MASPAGCALTRLAARDRHCIDCGRTDLLQYDHSPDFTDSKRTIIDELELRYAPCHQKRHQAVGCG